MNLDVQRSDAVADDLYVPEQAKFESWVEAVLEHEKVNGAEVAIRVVDEGESQQLNAEYRDKDKATNVLSFPMEAPDFIDPRPLGDLVICAQVVCDEALVQNKTCEAHWAHMVVHGMLHLLDYDHQHDDQADTMESLEIEIMIGLGYADPY